MPITRELTEALHVVIRQRMDEQGLSLNRLAEHVGINAPTLSRQLRGTGVLTLDEYDAIALALGARDLEELLAEARRAM